MNGLNNTVEIIAKWLEVVGFLVSIFTLFKVLFLNKEVKRINARHLFSVRVEEHLSEFKKTSSKIARLTGNFHQNIRDLRIQVSECLANCLSLKKKVNKSELTTLKILMKYSKNIINNKHDTYSSINGFERFFGKKPLLEKNIDEYYQTLALLIKEIEHLDKDIKKSLK